MEWLKKMMEDRGIDFSDKPKDPDIKRIIKRETLGGTRDALKKALKAMMDCAINGSGEVDHGIRKVGEKVIYRLEGVEVANIEDPENHIKVGVYEIEVRRVE